MEPIDNKSRELLIEESLGIANDVGIASRAITLGFLPQYIADVNSIQVQTEVAGGSRLIKLVYLPLHIKGLIENFNKFFDARKEKKRDIHAASTLNFTACLIEDVGLIGLGLNAVKILAVKTVVAAADVLSSVGLVLQLVSIYSEYKKMVNAEVHLKAIDDNEINYLDDKSRFHSFSDAVGMKRKVVLGVLEMVLDKKQTPSLMNRFVANLRSRVELGILNRKLNIIIAISFTAAVIIHLIPPLALVGWGVIGVLGLTCLGIALYKLLQTHYLNRELRQLLAT